MATKDLVSLKDRTTEEQHKIAKMGGIASGIARKQKATMRETLKLLLEMECKKGQTYREAVTLGLLKGAMKGNSNNYKAIVETLGELNSQESMKQNGVLVDLIEAMQNVKNNK